MKKHTRIIPRDFFNESKLLKCLGQLHLNILDIRVNGLPLTVEYDHEPFNIIQNPGDASLSCTNYRVFLKGEEIFLRTAYNSKDPYPLLGIYRGEEYYILDDQGKFMPNFGYEDSK